MPVVGKVTLVVPVVVSVRAFAPEVERLPARVNVLPPIDNEVTLVTASITFVPSQNNKEDLVVGIAMPVPLAVFSVTVCAVRFCIIYILLTAGHITVAAPVSEVLVSVRVNIADRDEAAVPFATDNVAELVLQMLITERPATASSTIEVILSFIVFPQLPVNSP